LTNFSKGNCILAAVFLVSSMPLLCAAAAQPTTDPGIPTGYLADAAVGLRTLQTWYVRKTGLWRTTGWWNGANAVTVLVDYSKLSGSSKFRGEVENTFKRNSKGKFVNKFFDDEGWWALAWIDAYEWSHDARYLDMAREIFADMTTGWNETCGGGIWWSKDRHYKNAIANELFLSVAANLASRSGDAREQSIYVSWVKREWGWFSRSGMINSQNLVNDGLDADCRNNGKTVWSYNQGVILGGLARAFQETQDQGLLQQAQSIAQATLKHLADGNGILHDACEPDCGADGVQFKGIFVRNLATLNSVAPQKQYETFLQTNAESIWNRDQGPNYEFGLIWSGPFNSANAASQISALDSFLAAESSKGPTRLGE